MIFSSLKHHWFIRNSNLFYFNALTDFLMQNISIGCSQKFFLPTKPTILAVPKCSTSQTFFNYQYNVGLNFACVLNSVGTYAFIETSSPRRTGHIARIRSKTFSATNGKCMSWWFHMYGSSVASLNVYIKKGGSPESLLWNTKGNQV